MVAVDKPVVIAWNIMAAVAKKRETITLAHFFEQFRGECQQSGDEVFHQCRELADELGITCLTFVLDTDRDLEYSETALRLKREALYHDFSKAVSVSTESLEDLVVDRMCENDVLEVTFHNCMVARMPLVDGDDLATRIDDTYDVIVDAIRRYLAMEVFQHNIIIDDSDVTEDIRSYFIN